MTEQTRGLTDVKAATEAALSAFESYKEANDERLAQIEKKGTADVLTEQKVARIGGPIATCAFLMPMLLSASCVDRTPAIDSCAWVKEIHTNDAIVRGSKEFETFATTAPRMLASSDRDILSPATAGQIVAHNRKLRQNCRDR